MSGTDSHRTHPPLTHAAVLVLTIVVVAVSAMFFRMIGDMLVTLALAIIFANMLAKPVFNPLRARLGGHGAPAAALTVALFTAAIFVPVTGIGLVVAEQAAAIAGAVGAELAETPPDDVPFVADIEGALRAVPGFELVEPHMDAVRDRMGAVIGRLAGFLAAALAGLAQQAPNFFLQSFLLLYAMFFFLKDGERWFDRVASVSPLPEADTRRFLDTATTMATATLNGTLLVGLVQGLLAGIGFAVAGVPAAAFLGAVTVLASVIPAIGTGFVWIPVAVGLLISGKVVAALGLAAWGVLIVGAIDNVLRPVLIGQRTAVPELMLFVGMFGGLATFGAPGFLLGPVITVLFISVWNMYGPRIREAIGVPTATEEA